MNRQTFILFFIACNITMIFLHIQNHTNIIRQLYRKQRNEKSIDVLKQKKAYALRTLYSFKNPVSIKEYAVSELHMQKIDLQQIKTVTFNGK